MEILKQLQTNKNFVQQLLNSSKDDIKKELTEYFLANPPKTDDELHTFISVAFGITIPRYAVCPNHSGVFDFIADAFFERYPKQIVLANRTGGKTLGVAVLNVCEAIFKDKCGIVCIGGAKQQAEQSYEYSVDFLRENPVLWDRVMPRGSLMSKTDFKNQSVLKVLSSSEKSVHHGHVPKVRLDEVDLIEPQIFEGALSIPLTKNNIKSNLLLTSTRFKPFGLMQKLIDSANQRGYKVYTFCYKDIAERCPDKRSGITSAVYYIHRKERKLLNSEEFIKIKDKKDEYVRYEMFDGCQFCQLATTCCGDLKRANGWYLIDDLLNKYSEESHMWDSQWECRLPYQGDLAFSVFDSEKSCKTITYNPNWDTYCSMDFGWAAPFYAVWFQVDWYGRIYIIDEYMVRNTIAKDYGKVLYNRGMNINGNYIRYKNVKFHGDPAGKSGNEVSGLSPIAELKKLYQIDVKTKKINPTARFNVIRKKMIGNNGETDFFIDKDKCPVLYQAICAAQLKKNIEGQEASEEIVRDDNVIHMIDALSYGIANVFKISFMVGK